MIPERGTPELLCKCLASITAALPLPDEPLETIVAANGSPLGFYAEHRRCFPVVRWLHSERALGFGGAVQFGLKHARFDWVYLLNSDMTIGPTALVEAARWRSGNTFAISSQVFFADPNRRREETGWTSFRLPEDGEVELFDAVPQDDATVRGHLYAGGGNSLFRKQLLLRYISRTRGYHPFYWEDVEWGVRAWRDGFEVLFCPASHVTHVHRATISRYFPQAEIDRIWRRNRFFFSLRNGFSPHASRALIRILRNRLDPVTQRELTSLRRCLSLLNAVVASGRSHMTATDFERLSERRYMTATGQY